MPAHVADDPLTPFPLRLPLSLCERLRAEAKAAGVTNSHVFRAYLDRCDMAAALPGDGETTLANRASLREPRRQPVQKWTGETVKADPQLVRILAGCANNLNQLAHQVNHSVLLGEPLSAAHILITLAAIDEKIKMLMDQK